MTRPDPTTPAAPVLIAAMAVAVLAGALLAEAGYTGDGWGLAGALTGIGGTLMTISAVMFFAVIIATAVAGRKGAGPRHIPVSETLSAPGTSPWERRLDNLWLRMAVAVVLIVIAYAPFFLGYLPPNMTSPGFRIY